MECVIYWCEAKYDHIKINAAENCFTAWPKLVFTFVFNELLNAFQQNLYLSQTSKCGPALGWICNGETKYTSSPEINENARWAHMSHSSHTFMEVVNNRLSFFEEQYTFPDRHRIRANMLMAISCLSTMPTRGGLQSCPFRDETLTGNIYCILFNN